MPLVSGTLDDDLDDFGCPFAVPHDGAGEPFHDPGKGQFEATQLLRGFRERPVARLAVGKDDDRVVQALFKRVLRQPGCTAASVRTKDSMVAM